MRDYGKNGKKCKHAYADGGKVVREQPPRAGKDLQRTVEDQTEMDRSGVRIPVDPQHMPQIVRSQEFFPSDVAVSMGPRGSGRTVAAERNPRATPNKPSEPEREGARTANMAKTKLRNKPEATPGGKRGGR